MDWVSRILLALAVIVGLAALTGYALGVRHPQPVQEEVTTP